MGCDGTFLFCCSLVDVGEIDVHCCIHSWFGWSVWLVQLAIVDLIEFYCIFWRIYILILIDMHVYIAYPCIIFYHSFASVLVLLVCQFISGSSVLEKNLIILSSIFLSIGKSEMKCHCCPLLFLFVLLLLMSLLQCGIATLSLSLSRTTKVKGQSRVHITIYYYYYIIIIRLMLDIYYKVM